MSELTRFDNVCIVSAIIPQHHAQYVLAEISKTHGLGAIQFDARGTLQHDRWYQRFLPMINPENEYLQFILPQSNVDGFVDFLIRTARLNLPGAGAVFTIPCTNYATSAPEYFCESRATLCDVEPENFNLKKEQSALFALIQSGRTEAAIRSSMQAGSHGPIVYFAEGRGTRDQIGWLKITKKPYEEVIMALVDRVDKEAVAKAIVDAGRINMPGGGVLYDQPVDKCLVNLPTSMGGRNALASEHQVVAAIDELMGNTNWRDRSAMASAENVPGGKNQKGNQDQAVRLLTLLVPRKHAYTIMDAAISFGAGGANVTYVKHLGGEMDRDEKTGFAFHHEMGLIRIVLDESKIAQIRQEVLAYCAEEDIGNLTVFEQKINTVIRYRSPGR